MKDVTTNFINYIRNNLQYKSNSINNIFLCDYYVVFLSTIINA